MGEWQGPMMETSWRPNMVARLLTPGWPETMGAEVNLSSETPTEVLVNGSPLSLLTSLLLTQVWIVHRPLLLQQQPQHHLHLHLLSQPQLAQSTLKASALRTAATFWRPSLLFRMLETPPLWQTMALANWCCRSGTAAASPPPACRSGKPPPCVMASSRCSTLVQATP